MKNYFFGIILSFVCIHMLFTTTAFSEDIPSALIAEKTYHFETVIEGDRVFHDFIIRNGGTAPLKIVKIESG